jgi:hypothetical protein
MAEEANSEARLAALLNTPKQRRFVILYVENGGNATAAAEGAGYSHAAVEGCRLLKNDKVLKAIEHHARTVGHVAGENRDTILGRMIDRANADPTQVWLNDERTRNEFHAHGLKHPSELSVELRRSIKSISFTQHGPKIEFYAADAADRDLANIMGYSRREDERLTAEDAAALIAASLDRMDELDHSAPASEG